MKKAATYSLVFAALVGSNSAFASRYAEAIQEYCTQKAVLPFADSRAVCIGNAKFNATGYFGILKVAKNNLTNQQLVDSQIQDLQNRIANQTSVAGFDLSSYLGMEEISRLLVEAKNANNAKDRDVEGLKTKILQAMTELRKFATQVK
jgi:hypothetical protein